MFRDTITINEARRCGACENGLRRIARMVNLDPDSERDADREVDTRDIWRALCDDERGGSDSLSRNVPYAHRLVFYVAGPTVDAYLRARAASRGDIRRWWTFDQAAASVLERAATWLNGEAV